MAIIEQARNWDLTITGLSGGVYSGNGIRVYVQNDVEGACGFDSLPSIGDTMIDPQSGSTYNGITCRSINYKRTHSTGAYGLTITCNYSSEANTPESQREDYDAGSFSADINTLTVQGGTSWYWYTDNTADGASTTFPIEPIDPDNGGPVSESLPLTVMQISRTKRIHFSSDASLESWLPNIQTYGGKLNNSPFLGFAKGQVLAGSVSGSKNHGRWDVDVVFLIRKIPDVSITQDDWNYMPYNKEGQTKWYRPVKAEPIVSPGAGYLETNAYGWMYDYADISNLIS